MEWLASLERGEFLPTIPQLKRLSLGIYKATSEVVNLPDILVEIDQAPRGARATAVRERYQIPESPNPAVDSSSSVTEASAEIPAADRLLVLAPLTFLFAVSALVLRLALIPQVNNVYEFEVWAAIGAAFLAVLAAGWTLLEPIGSAIMGGSWRVRNEASWQAWNRLQRRRELDGLVIAGDPNNRTASNPTTWLLERELPHLPATYRSSVRDRAIRVDLLERYAWAAALAALVSLVCSFAAWGLGGQPVWPALATILLIWFVGLARAQLVDASEALTYTLMMGLGSDPATLN